MGELSDLVATRQDLAAPKRVRKEHPKGWEPGVTWDGTKGVAVSPPTTERHADWDGVLDHFGFDPAEFRVEEPVEVRSWDAAVGGGDVRTMFYYRAKIRRRGDTTGGVDEQLLRSILRYKPPRMSAAAAGDAAFVVALSDWQMGKADYDGTQGIVSRVLATIGEVERRVRDLRKIGRRLGVLYVFGLGDLLEGCADHYASQTFLVELDRRSQTKAVRRLIVKAVTRWSRMFERVVLAGVGGNHGENRREGKAYTGFADNDDVAVLEQVAEILDANPAAFGHVAVTLPDDRLTMTLDVAGTVVGLAHGHQARASSTTVQAKLWRWWSDQAMGKQPVGDATILVTGHYHHLTVTQQAGRTHFQCPALDGGSRWWVEQTGQHTPPGTLTFVVNGSGWQDLAVLPGRTVSGGA